MLSVANISKNEANDPSNESIWRGEKQQNQKLPGKGQPGVTTANKRHLVEVKVFNTENVNFEFSSRIWNQILQLHQTHKISPWGLV